MHPISNRCSGLCQNRQSALYIGGLAEFRRLCRPLNLNQRVANFGGPRVGEQAEAQCLGSFRFIAKNGNDLRFFERRADLFFGSAETFGFAATCPSGGLVFAKVSLSLPELMDRAGGETFLGGKTGENKNVSENMPGYGFGVIVTGRIKPARDGRVMPAIFEERSFVR